MVTTKQFNSTRVVIGGWSARTDQTVILVFISRSCFFFLNFTKFYNRWSEIYDTSSTG